MTLIGAEFAHMHPNKRTLRSSGGPEPTNLCQIWLKTRFFVKKLRVSEYIRLPQNSKTLSSRRDYYAVLLTYFNKQEQQRLV